MKTQAKIFTLLKLGIHILGIATLMTCAAVMAVVMFHIQVVGYATIMEPNHFICIQEAVFEVFGACYAGYLFSSLIKRFWNNLSFGEYKA